MKSISPEEKAKRKKAAEEYRASWVAKNVKNEDTNEDVNLEEDFLDEDSGANVQVAHQAVMKSAEEIAAIRKNRGTKEEYGKALVAHSNATEHLSNMVKAHAADFMSKNSAKNEDLEEGTTPKTINQIYYVSSSSPTVTRVSTALRALGVKFTTRDVISNFHGIEFEVERPTGKGSGKKIDQIYRILDA
jgi:uncharacterized protein (DUF2225 family)